MSKREITMASKIIKIAEQKADDVITDNQKNKQFKQQARKENKIIEDFIKGANAHIALAELKNPSLVTKETPTIQAKYEAFKNSEYYKNLVKDTNLDRNYQLFIKEQGWKQLK